jgi:hypothetical protein
MFPIVLNSNFPIFLYENYFILDAFQQKKLTEHILNIKKMDTTSGKANIQIPPDNFNILKTIFHKFTETLTSDFFCSIDFYKTKENYWTYCTNRFDIAYVWHNHLRTSTMHSVYYLNVPCGSGGELDFEYNGKFFSYKPKRYDLIIMPDFLNHAPRQPLSDEYRISINMEAYCTQSSQIILQNFIK